MATKQTTPQQTTGERDRVGEALTQPRLARAIAMYEFCYPYVRDRKVLEVGCGTGYGTDLLADKAREVIGIDPDRATVEEARTAFKHDHVRYDVMDGCALDYPDGSMEAVVSILVIEHVKDYDKYIAESSRVLAPGGTYLLGALNRTTSLEDDAYHYREFSHDDLRRAMEPHFDKVEIYGLRGITDRSVAERKHRMARAMRYWRFDPLKLRRFYFVKRMYRPFFDYLQRKGRAGRRDAFGSEFDQIGPGDFAFSKEDPASAWTFMCVGHKGK